MASGRLCRRGGACRGRCLPACLPAAPPVSPGAFPFQLSYHMVSACARLCRMQRLCHLRKEEEEEQESLVGASGLAAGVPVAPFPSGLHGKWLRHSPDCS